MWDYIRKILRYEIKYWRMDQIKFVKGRLQKIWRNMVCLSSPYSFKVFKSCLPKSSFVHSWIFVSYATTLLFQDCFRNGDYHYCIKCDEIQGIQSEYRGLRTRNNSIFFTQCNLCKSERPVSKVLAFKKLSCLLAS